jgi:hypothetical protein
MIDANEYYLAKYEQGIEKSERLQAGFESDIEFDLEQILEHCNAIKSLAIHYEHEHCMDFDYKSYIYEYISENL